VYEEYERESYRLLQEQIAQIPGDRLPHQVRQAAEIVQYMIFCWMQCSGSGSGIRCTLDPGIREGKKSGSGMNNSCNFSESLEIVFRAKYMYT
jgi:hypothetical protein